MPRTKVRFYVQDTPEGRVAYSAKTGNPIRAEIKESTHELVDEAVGLAEREAYKDARANTARVARIRGAERRRLGDPDVLLVPGRARVRPDAPGAGRGAIIAPVPVFRPVGAPAAPAPAPAAPRERRPRATPDENTARVINKFQETYPQYYDHFMELARNHGSHYFKYNPVSHSLEAYNCKQVYHFSYQLPLSLRNKRTKGPIQHKYTHLGTDTIVYHSTPGGVQRQRGFLVHPPGRGRAFA
jgi:hypothetical protein